MHARHAGKGEGGDRGGIIGGIRAAASPEPWIKARSGAGPDPAAGGRRALNGGVVTAPGPEPRSPPARISLPTLAVYGS